VVEALLFEGEAQALHVVERCLAQAGDAYAARAAAIFHCTTLPAPPEEQVTCAECKAQDLEIFYTGQRWGEILCEACFHARMQVGTAKENI
jgi:hypothetical protein